MRSLRPTHSALLFLLAASALVACQPITDSDDESLGEVEQAVDLPPNPGTGTSPYLSMGYDTVRQAQRPACLALPTVATGSPSSNLHFDRSYSVQQAEQSLNFGAELSVRAGLYSVDAAVDLASSMSSNDLSDTMIYIADYTLQGQRLKDEGVDVRTMLTPVGLQALNAGTWQETCGDEVVYEKRLGAKFALVFRLDYATHQSKLDLHAKVDFSAPFVSVAAQISSHQAEFNQKVTVHMEAHQWGGDVSKISQVLTGTTGGAAGGAQALINCGVTSMSDCQTALVNGIAYASDTVNGFPSGINANPQVLKLITKSYKDIGVLPPAPIVSEELKQQRARLEELFNANVGYRSLFGQWKNAGFAANQGAGSIVDTWIARIAQNFGALSSAIDTCYKNVNVYDVSTVTACGTAVAALSTAGSPTQLLFPPDTLIGAGAIQTAINDAIDRTGGVAIVGTSLGPPKDVPWVDFGNIPSLARAQYQNFTKGTMYWAPGIGAHFLSGKIALKYQSIVAQGNVDKTVGFPSDDVRLIGTGRVLRLQNGDVSGSIYWDGKLAHDAFLVRSEIANRYAFFGENLGSLGFPTSDESVTYDAWGGLDGGRYNLFQFGAIYVGKSTPPSVLSGVVYQRWQQLGSTQSSLGFPLGDVQTVGDGLGTFGRFQHGMIYGKTSGFAIPGTTSNAGLSYDYFAGLYLGAGGPMGALGYPHDEYQSWGTDMDYAHHFAPSNLLKPGDKRIGARQLFDGGILYNDQYHYLASTTPDTAWDNRNGSWVRGDELVFATFGVYQAGWEYTRSGPRELYLCSGYYNNGKHPGKYFDGGCDISWGGGEVFLPPGQFEVLLSAHSGSDHWSWSNGTIPASATQTGYEADRRALYTCRVDAVGDGDRTPGKVIGTSPYALCAYPYGGLERTSSWFEVLSFDP